MAGGGEAAQVDANLRQQHLGNASADAGESR